MKKWSSRVVIGTCLGLSVACGAKNVTNPPPGIRGTDGTGTVGTNGLSPHNYNYFRKLLAKHYDEALLTDDGTNLNPHFIDIMEDGTNHEGKSFMGHVIQCVVKHGTQIMYKGSLVGTGSGILATTAGWLQGAKAKLGKEEQEDLHACLAALLNEDGQVQIWLNGNDTNHTVPTDGYPAIEAGWRATVSGDDVTIRVWPVQEPGLIALDSAEFLTQMKKRKCGKHPEECEGLKSGDGKCKRKDDILTCGDSDVRVIETRITCKDFCDDKGGVKPGPTCECNHGK